MPEIDEWYLDEGNAEREVKAKDDRVSVESDDLTRFYGKKVPQDIYQSGSSGLPLKYEKEMLDVNGNFSLVLLQSRSIAIPTSASANKVIRSFAKSRLFNNGNGPIGEIEKIISSSMRSGSLSINHHTLSAGAPPAYGYYIGALQKLLTLSSSATIGGVRI